MAINTRVSTGLDTDIMDSDELETLKSLLDSQGSAISHDEVVEMSYELLSFFEALGENNEGNDA
jgi:hypothetical protein